MAQLTRSKRDQLEGLLKSNHKHTQMELACIIGCSQPTISRELQRLRPAKRKRYTANTAQKRAEKRLRFSQMKRSRWFDNPDVIRYVIEELRDEQSPRSIAGRMKRESPWHKRNAISHQTIYNYIDQIRSEGGCLHSYLKYQGKKYKFCSYKNSSVGKIPNRRGIEERPDAVDEKKRCGDWESDLVVSSMQGKGAVATFAERYSRYLMAEFVAEQSSDEMLRASLHVFKDVPDHLRLTMTHDNGKEIAKHEQITKELKIDIYCANPYASWERGLNENLNRELRRYFPKGTDFSRVTEEELARAVEKINNKPRQSLRFCTAKEVFQVYINGYAFHV